MPSMRRFPAGFECLCLGLLVVLSTGPLKAIDCEKLSSVALSGVTFTAVESVAAGRFTPPSTHSLEDLPPFCRVAGVIKPTSDSYIRFEVWLPASGWNKKYLGVGNGGFAGTIDYNSLAGNLRRNYATAATDTGHQGDAGDASWAFKHPEKIVDFGYRALHLTTENAKALMQTFYGEKPEHSYFDSCSDGGREALMEAQRFPQDFEGILAGAPANNWTHMLTGGLEVARSMYKNPASYISNLKLPAITAAVLSACDAQDGVKDGVLNDPPKCHFDPSVLRCKGEESQTCLTALQIDSLRALYAGGHDTHGKLIFPGFMPGGEAGSNAWNAWIVGSGPGAGAGANYMDNYFRYMVFSNPAWNPLTADVEVAEKKADETTAKELNAVDPDLRRFQARGGKLMVYHGWSDPAISPLNAVSYYESVQAKMGKDSTNSFMRLYMIPGMGHCIGGPGATFFGQLGTATPKGSTNPGIYTALEQWVEKGIAPNEVIAAKSLDDNTGKSPQVTRPLCPYPQVAHYNGTSDPNDYRSFSCAPATQ